MPSKRTYLSDDDDGNDNFSPSEDETFSPSPRKRTRHQAVRSSRGGYSSIVHTKNSRRKDRRSPANTKSQQRATKSKPTAQNKLEARLVAELANLADYNAPPKARIEEGFDESGLRRRRSTRKRKAEMPHETANPQKSRKITDPPPTKRSRRSRLYDEVAELRPWAHWALKSEGDANSGSDTDDDDDPWPRSHVREYPPITTGVQNTPWSSLPAELRNEIYQYCMDNEEEKSVNVLHYPNGIPRRSVRGTGSANFSQSHWSFTQTCMEVRKEFSPWLLRKRSVRTPLATLNKYIETFHRRDLVTGQRIGKVEPFCNDSPLPDEGVEILELIREKDRSPDFHLQLTRTPMDSSWLAGPSFQRLLWVHIQHYDELDIFKKIDEHRQHTKEFASIRITSTPRRCKLVDVDGSDYEEENLRAHNIQLNFEYHDSVKISKGLEDQVHLMSEIIFSTTLSKDKDLQFQALIAGGVGRWMVRRFNVLDMVWKEKKKRGEKLFRRFTWIEPATYGDPFHYRIEDLD